jgi:RNA polymerase sigma-70 factor
MQEALDLVTIFLQHAPASAQMGRLRPEDKTNFERLLRHAWEVGRTRWPNIPLAAEVFVRYLAERLPLAATGDPIADALQFLDQVAHADLYLACACTLQIPAALQAFEHEYLSQLPLWLGHLRQSDEIIEEIAQQLRTKLFVPTPEAPPKIVDYSGRGTLSSWLWVVAARAVSYQLRATKGSPEDLVGAFCDALPSPDIDPELAAILRTYEREFRRAVADAVATLSDDERTLLRLSIIHRLSTVGIGRLYQKNQSTVSRWLQSIRKRIYEETRSLLKERLALSSREFEGLLRDLNSRLDITWSRLLKAEDDDEGENGGGAS